MADKFSDLETGCCKRFDPEPWDGKTLVFKNKLFVKDRVTSFFHIPLNFGKVMVRNMTKITAANASPEVPLMLSDESLFGSDLYIAVTKNVPDSEMTTISGTFLSKVFEGSFSNMGKWTNEMNAFVKSQGKQVKKTYFFYTTCPACAKVYGKNYVVLLAQIG